MRLASFALAAAMPLAQAATGTLTSQATVNTNCTISTTSVTFGQYDPIVANVTTALNATGTVAIACVKGTTPTVGLGLGSFASGSIRRMQNGTAPTEYLQYQLYLPPNMNAGTACVFPAATAWGATSPNLLTPVAAPNKNSRTFNVCGTVAAAQNVAWGNYADTVTATVNF